LPQGGNWQYWCVCMQQSLTGNSYVDAVYEDAIVLAHCLLLLLFSLARVLMSVSQALCVLVLSGRIWGITNDAVNFVLHVHADLEHVPCYDRSGHCRNCSASWVDVIGTACGDQCT
jgi:hypothetical protein